MFFFLVPPAAALLAHLLLLYISCTYFLRPLPYHVGNSSWTINLVVNYGTSMGACMHD